MTTRRSILSAPYSFGHDLRVEHPSRHLIARTLTVRAQDVVFVKGIVEAHDGLAHVFSAAGGALTLVSTEGREAELDSLVESLAIEFAGICGERASAWNAEPPTK